MLYVLAFVGPFAFTLLWLAWLLAPVPWYLTILGCAAIAMNQCWMLTLLPTTGRSR